MYPLSDAHALIETEKLLVIVIDCPLENVKSFHVLSSTIGNTALTYSTYNVAAKETQGWTANYVPIYSNI